EYCAARVRQGGGRRGSGHPFPLPDNPSTHCTSPLETGAHALLAAVRQRALTDNFACDLCFFLARPIRPPDYVRFRRAHHSTTEASNVKVSSGLVEALMRNRMRPCGQVVTT